MLQSARGDRKVHRTEGSQIAAPQAKVRSWHAEVRANRPRTMGTSVPPCKFLPVDKSARDSQSMSHAQPVSIFSRGWMAGRAALQTVAVLGLLAAPGGAPAQDAGVSGIPPGPANARGPNGSINDPSGIGNAAKVPAIPPPAISPVVPPTVSSPAVTRTFPVQRAVRLKRPRFATSRSRRAAAKTAVRENGKPIDGRFPSICRGC